LVVREFVVVLLVGVRQWKLRRALAESDQGTILKNPPPCDPFSAKRVHRKSGRREVLVVRESGWVLLIAHLQTSRFCVAALPNRIWNNPKTSRLPGFM
jgi:hypothetical protein